MLDPRDDLPPPIRPRIERTSPLRDLTPLAALIVVVFAGLVLYRSAMEPSAVSGGREPFQTEPPFVIASPPAVPPELIQMAVAISTSLAPTPTPPEPTPTYTMLPTPQPPDVCLTSTPRGSVCTQPPPPLPTSTPMADCPASPGELCVWRGGPVTWLSPTPSSERLVTVGANN